MLPLGLFRIQFQISEKRTNAQFREETNSQFHVYHGAPEANFHFVKSSDNFKKLSIYWANLIYYNKSKKLLVPFCFLFHSSVCLFVWIICCHIKKTIKADGKMVMAILKSSLKNLLTYSLFELIFRSENYLVCIDTHTFILTPWRMSFLGNSKLNIEHFWKKYMYSKDKSILVIKTLIINTLKMFH